MVILVEHEYNKLGIDSLVYSYDTGGNQLTRVTDSAPTASHSQGFLDGNTTGSDYSYDLNGNMTQDKNKGISQVTYNHLNLPQKIVDTSQTIEYIYSGNGQKLQKKAPNIEVTRYSGNFLYEGTSLKQVLHGEGYIDMSGTPTYHYYLKDHLGNNRMVVNQSGTVVQQTDYYPFGMTFNKGGSSDNKYLYNGKELQEDAIGNGMLDWLDYGARMYDPSLGRFHTQDPALELYYDWTPYNYVGNNPILRIDKFGKWDVTVHVYNDREQYGYGVAIVTDRNGNEVYRFNIRAEGTGGRDRMQTNADTPLGVYDIPDNSPWITGGSRQSYGPNARLNMSPESGEIEDSGRDQIRIHGGRQEVYNKKTKKWEAVSNPQLKKHMVVYVHMIRIWQHLNKSQITYKQMMH